MIFMTLMMIIMGGVCDIIRFHRPSDPAELLELSNILPRSWGEKERERERKSANEREDEMR